LPVRMVFSFDETGNYILELATGARKHYQSI